MTSSPVNPGLSVYPVFMPLVHYYSFYNHKTPLNKQISLMSTSLHPGIDSSWIFGYSIFERTVKDRDDDKAATGRHLVIANM
jgi:hypothetical protein